MKYLEIMPWPGVAFFLPPLAGAARARFFAPAAGMRVDSNKVNQFEKAK